MHSLCSLAQFSLHPALSLLFATSLLNVSCLTASGPLPTAMGLALLSAGLPAWPVLGFQGGHSGGSLSLYLHSRCSTLALLCFLTALSEFTPWTRGLLVHRRWTLYGHGFSGPSLSHTLLPWSLCCLNSLSLSQLSRSLKGTWTLDLGRPVVGFQGGLAGPLKGEVLVSRSALSLLLLSRLSALPLLSALSKEPGLMGDGLPMDLGRPGTGHPRDVALYLKLGTPGT